jgi:hypothetical protein
MQLEFWYRNIPRTKYVYVKVISVKVDHITIIINSEKESNKTPTK